MKFMKWLNTWRNAEVHHGAADHLSNHKLFQKIVLGIYNAPSAIQKKIENFGHDLNESEKKLEQQKLLENNKKKR